MAPGKEHPVWAIYDEMFLIKVNIHYLEWYKKRLEDRDLGLELFIAITTSSVVGAFWLWKTDAGSEIWKVVGLFAAIAAIIKPIIALRKKATEATELLTDARALDHEFSTICLLVRQYNEYKEEYRVRFIKAIEYKGNFIKAFKAGRENKKVQQESYNRVAKEFPPESFFVPSSAAPAAANTGGSPAVVAAPAAPDTGGAPAVTPPAVPTR